MTLATLADDGALAARLEDGALLVFKHSPICPVSARALRELEAFLAARPDVPAGIVDVLGARPLSQALAARTGVRHESPQALLLAAGGCAWHASHGAITRAALERAWDAHAGS